MSKKRKYRNDDEDPRIFSYYPHIAIFAVVFFGVSLGVGLSKGIDWLVTLGIVILAVTIAVLSLSKTIWLFWTVATVMKEQNEKEEREKSGEPSEAEKYEQFSAYYDCDDEQEKNTEKSEIAERRDAHEEKPAESKCDGGVTDEEIKRVDSSVRNYTQSSEEPKYWSGKDKLKVFSLVGAIAITLLTFMVGIFFANMGITSIGFPIMGAGGGGFALIIFVLIIVGVVQDRKNK